MTNRKIRLQLLLAICFNCWISNSMAESDSLVLPLWKNGAPGFENRKNEPEEAKDYWVKNIHNPTITVFSPPEGTANGTAVLDLSGWRSSASRNYS